MHPRVLAPLTSFRFLAALFVFTSHLPVSYLQGSQDTLLKWLYLNIFSEGYLGVTFFFILSGFVLTYTYAGRVTPKADFWLKRLARIYPLHIVTFILALPMVIGLFATSPVKMVLGSGINLALLQSFFPSQSIYFSFNSPSWSISNEMFFYACFPFILPLFSRLKVTALLFAGASVWGCAWLLAALGPDHESLSHWLHYIFPGTRLLDFIFGIVLGVCFLRAKAHGWQPAPASETIVIALFVVTLACHTLIPQNFRFSAYYQLCLGAFIFVFAFQAGPWSQLLTGRRLVELGEASYSFYLLHLLMIRYIDLNPTLRGFWTTFPVLGTFLCLGVVVCLSLISYRWIERPAQQAILKVAKRNPRAHTDSPVQTY